MSEKENNRSVGIWDTFKSVLSAFFGVQSEANRARDFRKGNPLHFVVIALAATAVFVLLVWGLVSLILGVAQSA